MDIEGQNLFIDDNKETTEARTEAETFSRDSFSGANFGDFGSNAYGCKAATHDFWSAQNDS